MNFHRGPLFLRFLFSLRSRSQSNEFIAGIFPNKWPISRCSSSNSLKLAEYRNNQRIYSSGEVELWRIFLALNEWKMFFLRLQMIPPFHLLQSTAVNVENEWIRYFEIFQYLTIFAAVKFSNCGFSTRIALILVKCNF